MAICYIMRINLRRLFAVGKSKIAEKPVILLWILMILVSFVAILIALTTDLFASY